LFPKGAVQVVLGEELFFDCFRDLALAGEGAARGKAQEQESNGQHAAENAREGEKAFEKESGH
jgi:hypothetical protein